MNAISPVGRVSTGPRRRTFQRIAAWLLIIFGGLFVLLMLVAPTDPANATTRDNVEGERAATVMGLVMLATGGGWLWATRRRDESGQHMYEEKAILAVAAKYGGRATIAQIALETHLSMDQAEVAINRLCGKNIAQPDLMDDGSVVYQFGMLA